MGAPVAERVVARVVARVVEAAGQEVDQADVVGVANFREVSAAVHLSTKPIRGVDDQQHGVDETGSKGQEQDQTHHVGNACCKTARRTTLHTNGRIGRHIIDGLRMDHLSPSSGGGQFDNVSVANTALEREAAHLNGHRQLRPVEPGAVDPKVPNGDVRASD